MKTSPATEVLAPPLLVRDVRSPGKHLVIWEGGAAPRLGPYEMCDRSGVLREDVLQLGGPVCGRQQTSLSGRGDEKVERGKCVHQVPHFDHAVGTGRDQEVGGIGLVADERRHTRGVSPSDDPRRPVLGGQTGNTDVTVVVAAHEQQGVLHDQRCRHGRRCRIAQALPTVRKLDDDDDDDENENGRRRCRQAWMRGIPLL